MPFSAMLNYQVLLLSMYHLGQSEKRKQKMTEEVPELLCQMHTVHEGLVERLARLLSIREAVDHEYIQSSAS